MTERKFVFYFGSGHCDFRVPEVLSIADMFGIQISIVKSLFENSPFYFVEAESEEDVRRIAERSVTLKFVFELWGYGDNYDDVVEQAGEFRDQFPEYVESVAGGPSFKFIVDAFQSKIGYNRKMELMKKFFFLEFKGEVKMDDPDNIFWIEEVYNETTKDHESPKEIFFMKQLCHSARDDIITYDLKKRNYLGTTSMDAELSLISSNIGQCRPGTIIMDPFAGTGSFLVSSAHYGSHVMGGDMDIFVLRGNPRKRGTDANVFTNFEQYGLSDKMIGVIRYDNSKHDLFVFNQYFNAIITDPPYGVREGAKKVGLRKKGDILVDDLPEGWHVHISQTVPYLMCDVLTDLFDLSARTIVDGGRLVFWLPTLAEYDETDLPSHACFTRLYSCYQGLTATYGRVLLCYKKTTPFNNDLHSNQIIEYDPEKSYTNYAMNYLKDPTRHELRHISKTESNQ